MHRKAAVASHALEKDAPELEDYDIMEQIGSGRTSTVYLVNCKRGRLRNRQLALRKVCTEITRLSGSSSLHQSLYHPCIVSLFSTFSTPLAHFYLLELCLGGSLSSYLSSYLDGNSITEGHLRGVLKSIIEALIYLKKEGVVHRNIRPSSVLLTPDGRIKLCNFDLATRLPPGKSPTDYFMKAPHFVAPEILSDSPFTCDADLWSVGCVSIACLSGRRPFEANSNPETVNKILSASYVLPETMSLEMQDLVVKLLELDPSRRIQLLDISSHSFFAANFPVIPLTSTVSQASESVLRKHALFESNSGPARNSISPKFTSSHQKYKRHSYAPNKTVIDDIRNTHRRNALQSEVSARRIVSDPLPLKQRHLAFEAASSSTSQQAQNDQSRRPPEPPTPSRVPIHCDLPDGSPPPIPIGTTRPLPFTTDLLSPEIHKTVHGQITVLPSCSLLVDLREGERRRGQKGTEVLLIDPQGTEIAVYSAPHLSQPCCLAEPTNEYTIENLPSAYWRQYNDAALLVDRIKQRTPKLILHTGAAKCTLMANSPRADVELLFGGGGAGAHGHGRRKSRSAETCHDTSPRMRIRLSRQCGSLEIATHTSGARGEEWTKKVLKTTDEYPYVSAPDWDTLEGPEQDGMVHLARFWRIWEALEQAEGNVDPLPAVSHPCGTSKSPSRTVPATESPTVRTPASFSSTQTLSLVNVAPRPSKLSFLPATTRRISRPPSTNDVASIEGQHLSVTGKTAILPTWCRDDLDLTAADHRAPQTKFIPSVGWCIRHNSRVSQGGRYKIMFFDGAVLEIDVDEDWAELTSQAGETTRCVCERT
ncbi:kinase-like domain-containing protein [Mycena epipterygia]|nr:kinase-like domain-containing protein [Mycena epipterygia]